MAELKRAGDPLTTEAFAADRGDFRDPPTESRADDSQREESDRASLGRNEPLQIRDAGKVQSSGVARSPAPRPDNSVPQHAVGGAAPLLPESEIGEMRSRWNNIQAEFVDEPRQAVEQADQLVATAIERLADGFQKERASLEKQWESGNDVSTEDLRLALQRYREFFGKLLNAA